MTRSVSLSAIGIALTLFGATANACTIFPDERSPRDIRNQSKPIVVTPMCAVADGGVYDEITLSAAEDLHEGRIVQRIYGSPQHLLLVDCSRREATILRGPIVEKDDSGCGDNYTYADLIGPEAIMPMTEGDDLTSLVRLAQARGAEELNPTEFFNTDPWGNPVPSKDRYNLLCGCMVLYPGSAGARQ